MPFYEIFTVVSQAQRNRAAAHKPTAAKAPPKKPRSRNQKNNAARRASIAPQCSFGYGLKLLLPFTIIFLHCRTHRVRKILLSLIHCHNRCARTPTTSVIARPSGRGNLLVLRSTPYMVPGDCHGSATLAMTDLLRYHSVLTGLSSNLVVGVMTPPYISPVGNAFHAFRHAYNACPTNC